MTEGSKKASVPRPKRQSRRERRWKKASPISQLPKGRQLALRLVDVIEDAVLVMHIILLGFVAFVHLLSPTRGFLLFIAAHEALRPDEGKGFYDQYTHVLESEHSEGFSVEVRRKNASKGVSWGLITNTMNGDGLYLMVEGRDVRLYEIASPVVELAKHQSKESVARVGIFNSDFWGAVLTVDGRPLWILEDHVGKKVGPAMMHRPELKSDDTASFEVTIWRAPGLSYEELDRSLRIIEPVI